MWTTGCVAKIVPYDPAVGCIGRHIILRSPIGAVKILSAEINKEFSEKISLRNMTYSIEFSVGFAVFFRIGDITSSCSSPMKPCMSTSRERGLHFTLRYRRTVTIAT